MKRISVFCGSSAGNDSVFTVAASALGKLLAEKQYSLVYGGASVGLMGIIADAVLMNGGEAIGVIPNDLKRKEIAHPKLTQLIEVSSMHERKQVMSDLSDAVIALPGGFGTLDELFEMLTWSQLGYHQQPIAVLNIDGFYDHLQAHIVHMVEKGFLKSVFHEQLIFECEVMDVIKRLESFTPQRVNKWMR